MEGVSAVIRRGLQIVAAPLAELSCGSAFSTGVGILWNGSAEVCCAPIVLRPHLRLCCRWFAVSGGFINRHSALRNRPFLPQTIRHQNAVLRCVSAALVVLASSGRPSDGLY